MVDEASPAVSSDAVDTTVKLTKKDKAKAKEADRDKVKSSKPQSLVQMVLRDSLKLENDMVS